MGRRNINKCFVVSEKPNDNPDDKYTIITTACGQETSWLSYKTEDRSKATCPKCSEKLAKEDLAAMDSPLKFGDKEPAEQYGIYRSEYPILDGEDLVGMIRLPHGWGKMWEVVYPSYTSEGIRYYMTHDERQGFRSKSAALVWASNNRSELNTVEEAKRDYEERKKRAQATMERQAQEDAAERKRLDDTIEGLESVVKNRADALSNFEMSAVQDAVLVVKQSRLKV